MKQIAYEIVESGSFRFAFGPHYVRFLCEANRRIHGKRFYVEISGMTTQTWLSDDRAKELGARMHKITAPVQFTVKDSKWICRSCMREFEINDNIGPNSACPGEDCPSKFEEVGKTHPDCQPATR